MMINIELVTNAIINAKISLLLNKIIPFPIKIPPVIEIALLIRKRKFFLIPNHEIANMLDILKDNNIEKAAPVDSQYWVKIRNDGKVIKIRGNQPIEVFKKVIDEF